MEVKNSGFRTQKKCPFPLIRGAPSIGVTDTKIMWAFFSGTKFCVPWMEVSLNEGVSRERVHCNRLLYLFFVEGSNCPAGWVNNGSSCYYVKDIPTLKQSDARQHCQNLGGDLAIIKSENQNDFIFSLIQSQKTFTKWGAWIGIQRKADGKFYWIDNTPVDGSYSIWAGGEPNNAGGSENCVQIYGNHRFEKTWNDFSCELGSHVTDAPVILCQKTLVWSGNRSKIISQLLLCNWLG